MEQHRIVSREEWLAARKAHLVSEKELTKLHDRVSAERRALPWVKVDKGCVFDGPDGRETLERRPIRLDHRRRIQPQRGSCGTRLA
jgi:predicted dithiol-disulfide oxidoreductase (DUF899 family)